MKAIKHLRMFEKLAPNGTGPLRRIFLCSEPSDLKIPLSLRAGKIRAEHTVDNLFI